MSDGETLILVIDDEDELRRVLCSLLTRAGYRVETAVDGHDGLDRALALCPDLILCDLWMPGLDGFEVLSAVREHPPTALVPFLFLTGNDDPSSRRQGMALGADDYLNKPFGVGELLSAVEARLRSSRARTLRENEVRERLSVSVPFDLPKLVAQPLSDLQGLTDLLQSTWRDLDPSELEEVIEGLHRSVLRVSRSVEKASWVARARSNGTERSTDTLRETTPDTALVVGVTARHLAEAVGRLDDLVLDLEEVSCGLAVGALQRLVRELVDNALDFTVPGDAIRVEVKAVDGQGVIRVEDRGQGVSADLVDRVAQGSAPGLGLSLCTEIAGAVGGSFSLERLTPSGTLAEVRLPLGRDDMGVGTGSSGMRLVG